MTTQLEDLNTELAAVTKAVNAAYSGSEYEIASGGTRRRLKRQDLNLLLRRKAELELSIQRLGGSTGGGIRHGIVVDSDSCLNQ